MSDNQLSLQSILVGAVIGGMLGGTAASCFASKQSSGIRDNFNEYSDKIQAFIHSVNDNVSNSIHEKAESLSTGAQDAIDFVKKEMHSFCDLENKDFRKGLLVGAALGSLLGAGGAALFNGRSEKSDQDSGWKKAAKQVLDVLDHKCSSGCRQQSRSVDDVLDFAATGIKLWQNLHKR